MPDNDASKSVEQQPEEQSSGVQALDSPAHPDSPHSQPAKAAANQDMQREVQGIEDRVKRAERWMIFLTAVIATLALAQVIVGYFQWSVMSGQLGEMQAQIELTDRAWIQIGDATPPHDGRLGLGVWPNRYNRNAKPQVRVGFDMAYKNVGHSAAENIKIATEVYLVGVKHYSDNVTVEAEEKRFCSIPIEGSQSETSGKSVLFPVPVPKV